MREVVYKDEDGRLFVNAIPDDAPDSHAEYGIRIGPPDLDSLQLPLDTEVRLNNALFNRQLLRRREVKRNRDALVGALMSVLKVDADKILELYE